jgi:hypothetical protein
VKKLVGTLGVWYIDTKQKERQEDSYGRIFDQRYYKRRTGADRSGILRIYGSKL